MEIEPINAPLHQIGKRELKFYILTLNKKLLERKFSPSFTALLCTVPESVLVMQKYRNAINVIDFQIKK